MKGERTGPESILDGEIDLLLEAIYRGFHYDFRGYSRASLTRRISAALGDFGCESVSSLQGLLQQDPNAFPRLLRFLTVPVSHMFRDPAFFRSFRERVVPELATYPSIRLWVAGCSTGEEVYSLAIVLHEEGLLQKSLIYATDIDAASLQRAETGVYPLDRIPMFTENYRASGGTRPFTDYCTSAYGSAIVDRSLRANIVFADHSLATDSVFAEVHVVSCRNVLIYFARELQLRAVSLFRDALCRRGFLGLGSGETLRFTPLAESFQALVEPDARWYRRW
jgi:chemotaxis protein methyltransferase CheR